jgi:hypothetical protein
VSDPLALGLPPGAAADGALLSLLGATGCAVPGELLAVTIASSRTGISCAASLDTSHSGNAPSRICGSLAVRPDRLYRHPDR